MRYFKFGSTSMVWVLGKSLSLGTLTQANIEAMVSGFTGSNYNFNGNLKSTVQSNCPW